LLQKQSVIFFECPERKNYPNPTLKSYEMKYSPLAERRTVMENSNTISESTSFAANARAIVNPHASAELQPSHPQTSNLTASESVLNYNNPHSQMPALVYRNTPTCVGKALSPLEIIVRHDSSLKNHHANQYKREELWWK
jgi:hypothetical protein